MSTSKAKLCIAKVDADPNPANKQNSQFIEDLGQQTIVSLISYGELRVLIMCLLEVLQHIASTETPLRQRLSQL